MGPDDGLHQVQLLQRRAYGPVAADALGQVQRPEQRADMPLPQPRHIGVDGTLAELQVEPRQMPQRPRQSAVPVGDGMRGEDGVRPLQGLGVRIGDRRVRLRIDERVGQVVEPGDLAGGVQFVLEVCHGGLRTS
jgi:hypothetical protein